MSLIEGITSAILGRRIESPPPAVDLLPPGVTLREGRLIPWIGGVLGGMSGAAAAVTLRRTIVINPGVELTPALLAHELTHVRQWRAELSDCLQGSHAFVSAAGIETGNAYDRLAVDCHRSRRYS